MSGKTLTMTVPGATAIDNVFERLPD